MEEVFEGIRAAFSYNDATKEPTVLGISSALAATWHSVNWAEPWLSYVLLFHTCLALLCCANRRRPTVLVLVFACILVGVHLHPVINTLASRYWRSFAGRNYFDDSVVLVRLLWTLPQLLLAFSLLVFFLVDSAMSARSRFSRPFRLQRPPPIP